MHVDEYREGFGHRTRSNRPRARRSDAQAEPVVPVTYPAEVAAAVREAWDRPIDEAVFVGCEHLGVREHFVGGVAVDRQCLDCGCGLPDRWWED